MFPDIINLQGLEDKGCGEFFWQIKWQIPVPAAGNGYIVQKLTAAFDIQNADGSQYMSKTLHFWEAWLVEGGQQTTTYPDYDDVYRNSPYRNKKGTVSITGTAKFYEVVLSADFKANNPASLAGELLSTTILPSFWDGTGTEHNLTCEWDCVGKPYSSHVVAQAGSTSFVGRK